MSTPVLHLLAGPNGAGKTAFYEHVLAPVTHLPFINADRTSFVTETVFSHPSKVDLVRAAAAAGYQVTLHVVMVPVDLSVARERLELLCHRSDCLGEVGIHECQPRLAVIDSAAVEEPAPAPVHEEPQVFTMGAGDSGGIDEAAPAPTVGTGLSLAHPAELSA